MGKEEFPIVISFLASLAVILTSESAGYEKRADDAIEMDFQRLKTQRGIVDFPRKVKMENIAHNVIATMTIHDELWRGQSKSPNH